MAWSLLLFHIQWVSYHISVNEWAYYILDFWIFGGGAQKKEEIFKGRNQISIKLWYKGKKVLINKVSDSIHKNKVLRKPQKLLPSLQLLRSCVHQNISLRDHRDSTKSYPEVGKSGIAHSENLIKLL